MSRRVITLCDPANRSSAVSTSGGAGETRVGVIGAALEAVGGPLEACGSAGGPALAVMIGADDANASDSLADAALADGGALLAVRGASRSPDAGGALDEAAPSAAGAGLDCARAIAGNAVATSITR
jgi:hypothetical protein